MRRGLMLLAFLLVGSVAATARAATPASCGKLLPPAQGVYFGVMPGWASAPTTFDDAVDSSAVRQFERYTGRNVVFAPFSMSWHDRLSFPTHDVEALWRAGYVPQIRLVNWPTEDSAPPIQAGVPVEQPTPPGPVPNSAIAAGRHDAELRRFADAARATDIPISLDYDPEMDSAHPFGGRFDGGATTTGYGDPTWPDGPEHYRDAYRRIITLFREEGATNVTFIFQPNTPSGYVPGGYYDPSEEYRWYYPGDDYIDWLGLSVYAEPIFGVGPNAGFEHKLAVGDIPGYEGPYAEITALGSKPLVINELGLQEMPSEQAKAQWVGDAAAVLESRRYPRIGAINWWAQKNGGFAGYPTSSQTFLDGFKAAFDQPFFDAKAQFSGDCRPLAPKRLTLHDGVLTWPPVPNAASYQVWRGSTLLARTQVTSAIVGPAHGWSYRVRGVDLAGFGPFATTTRKQR